MARRMSRLRLLIVVAALPLALWLALPVLSDGAPLSSQIEAKKRAIAEKKGRERVLTSTITAYTERIDVLEGDITVLQARQTRIETELANKRAELARIQDELRRERIRLVRLRARLAEARVALSERLVELYKADEPDVVTVILESDGFADLLERAEFIQRVSEQDARIIDHVRTAKAEAVATERRLDALEERQREVTAAVARRAAEVDAIKDRLIGRQQEFQGVRDQKQQALVGTRTPWNSCWRPISRSSRACATRSSRRSSARAQIGASSKAIWPRSRRSRRRSRRGWPGTSPPDQSARARAP